MPPGHKNISRTMKHRRGINLEGRGRPTYVGQLVDVAMKMGGLAEWECVGGRCGVCEREAWLDRWALQRRGSIILSDLADQLRCRACGNTVGNKVILGRLPRD